MLVKKKDRLVFEKKGCKVFEYGGTQDLDVGVAEIEERYPEKGWARNIKVDMTYFVLEGGGKLFLEKEVYEIVEGDLVIIERGKWYRAEGKMRVLMASGPAWSLGQYEERE
jgi:mannose-6-phosphate isomerase-like protein (cupin superfamily)